MEELKERVVLGKVTKGTIMYQRQTGEGKIRNIYIEKDVFDVDNVPKELEIVIKQPEK